MPTDTTQRKRTHQRGRIRTALIAGVVVAGLPSVAAPALAAPPTSLSGVYSGSGDAAGSAAAGVWRKARVTVALDFANDATWSTLSDPRWIASQHSKPFVRMSLSVAMLPRSGGSMSTGAAGGYNSSFKTLGRRLVAAGHSNSIIRLGWEMNGEWYRWSAVKSPSTYIAYWKQVVNTMRAVPGQRFAFDWCPNSGSGKWGFNTASAYPGDAYVDIIGADLYDQSWAVSSAEDAKRWTSMLTTPYGLNWLAAFSASHNKPISVPEWGLSQRSDGHGGGDNPAYVSAMHAWMKSHRVLYESYFDVDMGAGEKHSMTAGWFPLAAARYRSLWATS